MRSSPAWTDAYLAAAAGRDDLADPEMVGYYHPWLNGSLEGASATASAGPSPQKPSPAIAVNAMIIADADGGQGPRATRLLAKIQRGDEGPGAGKTAAICG